MLLNNSLKLIMIIIETWINFKAIKEYLNSKSNSEMELLN